MKSSLCSTFDNSMIKLRFVLIGSIINNVIATQSRQREKYVSRRLAMSDGYNFMFYFVVATILLTCLVYHIFFKRKMEANFLYHNAMHGTMLRQDVIASDTQMNNLWECEVCYFKSYQAQTTCMLCGTEKSFRLLEIRRTKALNYSNIIEDNDMRSTESSSISSSNTATTVPCHVMKNNGENVETIRPNPSRKVKDLFKKRLSALNLRQQSARRRHEWIRHKTEEGKFIWKRDKKGLDRRILQSLNSTAMCNSSSSLRDSTCSNGSTHSLGLVSHLVMTPTNPNGRLSFGTAEGAPANRCSETSSHFTPEELEEVSRLPFQQKHAWFVQHTAAMEVPWEYGHLMLEIQRENLLQNSCEQLLWASIDQLHQCLRIRFVNEPGVDAGGLVREWFTLMTQEVFDDHTGLFVSSANDNALMINPLSREASIDHLMYFQAIGRFIGRALFEGILIDAHLALPICKHLLGIPITFSDLEFVDNELYKNLKWLKENEGVESLALDFTVSLETLGENEMNTTIELIQDGANIAVTDANKKDYIDLRFKWMMANGISAQMASFVQGLYEVIPKELLSVFDHQELELLICGIPEIDMKDWQENTIYLGEQNLTLISWFWEIIRDFNNVQRARLLQFTTGSTRVPVQGFKALTMNDGRICPFTIQCVSKEQCLYPRAHTCFNRIDLPSYGSKKDLRIALTLVIQMEVTGFTIE